MKTTLELPAGYVPIMHVDLQKDKKKALLINGMALGIGLVLALIGHMIVPFGVLFSMESGLVAYFARFLVLLGGMFLYVILHELVHGVFMKRFSGKKPSYGFTGVYAYAGSDVYFNKKHYRIIALAPVVVWGFVLAILCCVVPEQWFWVAYFIQINNLSGAAGDYYVAWKFRSLPEDILIQDSGVAMTVYAVK